MTTVDDNSIAWTKAVSTNGNIFEVGVKKSEAGPEPPAGPIQSVTVDWKTSTSGNPTGSVQDKTGIVFYSLQDNNPSIYDWRLDITTNRKYDYYFEDASGDKYRINVFSIGSHYVRYNSDKPTIVKVLYS